MKKKLLFILIAFFLVESKIFPQSIDSINIYKANNILKEYFNNNLGVTDYLLYNIADNYIVIKKSTGYYTQYFVKQKIGIEDSIEIKLDNEVLNQAFNFNSYHKGFTNINSDSIYQYYNSHSVFIYFVIKQNGIKFSEFNLPLLFNVNIKNRDIYPIDKKVHDYLMNQISSRWKVKSSH